MTYKNTGFYNPQASVFLRKYGILSLKTSVWGSKTNNFLYTWKHCLKALFESTLWKHCLKALFESTVWKHFSSVWKHFSYVWKHSSCLKAPVLIVLGFSYILLFYPLKMTPRIQLKWPPASWKHSFSSFESTPRILESTPAAVWKHFCVWKHPPHPFLTLTLAWVYVQEVMYTLYMTLHIQCTNHTHATAETVFEFQIIEVFYEPSVWTKHIQNNYFKADLASGRIDPTTSSWR